MSTILIYLIPIASMLGMITAGFFFARWYYNIDTSKSTTTTTTNTNQSLTVLNTRRDLDGTDKPLPEEILQEVISEHGRERVKFNEETEKWLNEK